MFDEAFQRTAFDVLAVRHEHQLAALLVVERTVHGRRACRQFSSRLSTQQRTTMRFNKRTTKRWIKRKHCLLWKRQCLATTLLVLFVPMCSMPPLIRATSMRCWCADQPDPNNFFSKKKTLISNLQTKIVLLSFKNQTNLLFWSQLLLRSMVSLPCASLSFSNSCLASANIRFFKWCSALRSGCCRPALKPLTSAGTVGYTVASPSTQ